jgi:predicted nucleic acid-binding protein
MRLLGDDRPELHAPDLIHEMTEDKGLEIPKQVMESLSATYPTSSFVESAIRIAVATVRTVYDCIDVALAVSLDCAMVTADENLVNTLQTSPWAPNVLWIGVVERLFHAE